MPNDVTALSLFAGLGGLDWGARIAGVSVEGATDLDGSALKLLHEAQGTCTHKAEIWDVVGSDWLRGVAGDLDLDLVIGGPPCTGFSHAGFWIEEKRAGSDPAVDLLNGFVEVVRETRPRAFIMENVPGLQFRTFKTHYESLVNRMRRGGYSVTARILDASEYGVPQARRRLFVVGVRGGPKVDLATVPQAHPRSSSWAISQVSDQCLPEPDEVPGGIHSRWISEVPPGDNYLALTAERGRTDAPFEYRARYWSFLLKLHPDRPAPTLPAQRVTYNGPFHWNNRHLRLRELARLQTFPDVQPLHGDLATARRHLGNAVPPILGAAVVRHVVEALELASPDETPVALLRARDPDSTFEQVTRAFPGRP